MSLSRPTLLMTRPLVASQRFVAELDQTLIDKCDVVISPLIRIEYLSKPLNLEGVGGVIFTSAHGVHAVRHLTDAATCPAYCVGPATTRAAIDAGWQAQQSGQDAESLLATLLEQGPAGPLLHVRGAHARGDVARRLTKQGLTCDDVVLYTQTAQPFSKKAITALQGDGAIIAPIFSPRTASLFRQGILARPVHVVTMSQAVADELDGMADLSVVTACAPDAHEMRALVEKLLQSHVPG